MTEHVPADEVEPGRMVDLDGRKYFIPDSALELPPITKWDWLPDTSGLARNKLHIFSEGFLGLHRPEGFVHVSGC